MRYSFFESCNLNKISRLLSCQHDDTLTEILNNLGMIEILEQLDFRFEREDHSLLSKVVFVGASFRQFDLLDGEHISSRDVHGEIDLSVRSSTNQFSLDPFERD